MRFNISIPILAVIGVLIIGGIAYFDAPQGAGEHTASAAATVIPKFPARMAPDGFREHRSERYGFSLFYPAAMGVTEQDEGQGATTFTFEDVAGERGFQIFVLPYNESQVSAERFRMDVPSGVRENERIIPLDGVEATAFESMDEFVGETREVWFIANSHLYELTAPAASASELDAIVASWKFTD